MKILCTADIHIGRRASRLAGRVDDERRFSAANAWTDIVDYAIDQEVSLLLLAGDVVDQENRYFEAYGPLEAGIRRLAESGIFTIAVAGNHDIEVLPRLDRALDASDFRLLGRGGIWDIYTFEQDGKPILHVYGWSFPQRHVRDNPLTDFQIANEDDAPVIVLLHADLDNANSPYGPVSQADLEKHNCDFWLLGHIHQPTSGELKTGSRFLYPGSPMALDPGERGIHGPWMLELDGRSINQPEQIPLSRVRYEHFEVSLNGIEDDVDFQTRVTSDYGQQLRKRIKDPNNLELICSRLALSGRTKLNVGKRRELIKTLKQDLILNIQNANAFLEDIEDLSRPHLDLELLSRETSPPGILARLLLELEIDKLSSENQQLLKTAKRKLTEIYGAPAYSSIASDEPPDITDTKKQLLNIGNALLDTLVSQQEKL